MRDKLVPHKNATFKHIDSNDDDDDDDGEKQANQLDD